MSSCHVPTAGTTLVSSSASWWILSLAVSAVGLGIFLYGKKAIRIPQVVAGIALMVAPYVATEPIAMLAATAGVLGALWLALRMGL